MSAYVIVEVTIHDPVDYEAYKKLTPAAVAAYGGAVPGERWSNGPAGGRLEPGANGYPGISFS